MAEAKRRELQDRINEIRLDVRTGKQVQLAASAGASVFPHDGTTYEMLLADADQRMYRDKAAAAASSRLRCRCRPSSSRPSCRRSCPLN